HEISQPIGAIMAGADAAPLWLGKTPPQLGNVRASGGRIAIYGHPASEGIAHVRHPVRRDRGALEAGAGDDPPRPRLRVEADELQRQGIAVRTDLAADANVAFDRTQLHQVVLNLVANAMQAMSPVTDRPRVLRVETAARPSGDVVIGIEDSGIGIERASLD